MLNDDSMNLWTRCFDGAAGRRVGLKPLNIEPRQPMRYPYLTLMRGSPNIVVSTPCCNNFNNLRPNVRFLLTLLHGDSALELNETRLLQSKVLWLRSLMKVFYNCSCRVETRLVLANSEVIQKQRMQEQIWRYIWLGYIQY